MRRPSRAKSGWRGYSIAPMRNVPERVFQAQGLMVESHPGVLLSLNPLDLQVTPGVSA